MHLVIDGYGGNVEKMKDSKFVHDFLDTYPDTIGMTKITEPHVYVYHGQHPEDWGVSGFVIIAESHISVHTFPERNYINIDLFSCKDFDTDKALKAIKGDFELEQTKSWTLERGLEYSEPEVALRELNTDREHLTHTRKN